MRLKIGIGDIWLRQLVLASLFVFFDYLHDPVDVGFYGDPVLVVFQFNIVFNGSLRGDLRDTQDFLVGIFLLQPAENVYG